MSNRRSIPTLLTALLLLLHLAGCASDLDVSTAADPLTRFPRQATYAWDAAANSMASDERLHALDLPALIKETANEQFAAQGYRAVTSGSPDFRLSYELGLINWIGGDQKTIGSLSLHLVDPTSNRLVWNGYGKAPIHAGLSRAERKARLGEAIAEMLEEFPPEQRGD